MAASLGWHVSPTSSGSYVVNGPDGYVYEMLPRTARVEPFSTIHLGADDPMALAAWYNEFLHMKMEEHDRDTVTVSYGGHNSVAFRIERSNGSEKLQIGSWDEYSALPEAEVRDLNERIVVNSHLVLHSMRELNEALGTLVIVILKDPQGYELCVVSSETFNPSVAAATDHIPPNWSEREAFLAALNNGGSDL